MSEGLEWLYCSRCEFGIRVAPDEMLPDACPKCEGASWADVQWLSRDELELAIQEQEEEEADIDPFWYLARAMDRIDVSAGMRWGSMED